MHLASGNVLRYGTDHSVLCTPCRTIVADGDRKPLQAAYRYGHMMALQRCGSGKARVSM